MPRPDIFPVISPSGRRRGVRRPHVFRSESYGLNGLNGFAVAVEADVSGGLPAFSLVGLPDSAVRESGDRVRSAVKNLGYKWPDRHITVNLCPGGHPQERPGI